MNEIIGGIFGSNFGPLFQADGTEAGAGNATKSETAPVVSQVKLQKKEPTVFSEATMKHIEEVAATRGTVAAAAEARGILD